MIDLSVKLPDILDMKTARLEARLTEVQKELVEKAAGYQGVSQTDFVLMSVLDEARRIVTEHEVIELTRKQSRIVAEALIDPPEPNVELRKSFREHRNKVI